MGNLRTQNSTTLASIIVVCWNSVAYLSRCLDSLCAQTNQNFEVILVDNGSTDHSTLGLKKAYPRLNLLIERLDSNLGFATANNIGARLAGGKWLVLLNADAFPETDWLENLILAAENHPEFSFFASRQIQANNPELLDGAGDSYHISGLAWRRYADFPAEKFGFESDEVFGACAAAVLYSREAFLQVGGFDEDFFSYHEDVDLSFRLRLQGFRCLYVPDAMVRHIGSASLGVRSDFAVYHAQRNFIWSFVQNMPFTLLWIALPSHLIANVIYFIYYTLRGHGPSLWKAKIDAFRGLSRALKKRKEIQKNRRITTGDLLQTMERGFLQPYLLGYNIRKVRHLSNPPG